MEKDIKLIEKNKRPIANDIWAIFDILLFLWLMKKIAVAIIKNEYFSIFNPTIKDVMVVAILLPKTIPILWLNVKMLAFISAIVSIIRAELDCIMAVEMNPVNIEWCKEDVKFWIFCLILMMDNFSKSFVNKSIEYIKSIIPEISNETFIIVTSKVYLFGMIFRIVAIYIIGWYKW